MARFLHLADIHLGYSRYNNPERTKDFYFALVDVLERYAIDEQVDFVVIVGDLFEHRNILPGVLNQAQNCLVMLQEAGIPVIAIEGNHDNRPHGIKTSWLRYLAERDWLILLEPEVAETGDYCLGPWDSETKAGGYIDLDCGVRVVGSSWYGAAAPQAIQQLANVLTHVPPGPDHTVMLFHHGLEGQVARYTGALRYGDLLPLREAGVDYLAMGHIHKNYEMEGWIFNPGSLEANSVAENQQQNPRGVYLVQLDENGVEASLKQDYQQRPILRLALEVEKQWTQEQVCQEARDLVQRQNAKTKGAIVELRIRGQVGFNRLDLNSRQLKEELQQLSQALVFLFKYEVVGTEYQSPIPQGEQLSRSDVELIVFKDLLAAQEAYGDRLEPLTRGLQDLKGEILSGQSEAELYGQVEKLLRSD
jgi:DNA repair exonuclease SbcCD nuclease subunit